MDFGTNKTSVEIKRLLKELLEKRLLETFTLVLMINGAKTYEKNLMF